MAGAVPVVAVGRGGPVDLIDSSRNGWLYKPGDTEMLRARVADLVGDNAKRAAFSRTAYDTVQTRTWTAVCDQLMEHYAQAQTVGSRAPRFSTTTS